MSDQRIDPVEQPCCTFEIGRVFGLLQIAVDDPGILFAVTLPREFHVLGVERRIALRFKQFMEDFRDRAEQFDLQFGLRSEIPLDARRAGIEQFACGDAATRLVRCLARIAGLEHAEQEVLGGLRARSLRFGDACLRGSLLCLPQRADQSRREREDQRRRTSHRPAAVQHAPEHTKARAFARQYGFSASGAADASGVDGIVAVPARGADTWRRRVEISPPALAGNGARSCRGSLAATARCGRSIAPAPAPSAGRACAALASEQFEQRTPSA